MSAKPKSDPYQSKPEILAPAGNRLAFLAAIAAGADAIYCGLKSFSARMEAKNFSLNELAALTKLAHEKGAKVYVALNALLKPNDLIKAGTLLEQIQSVVGPDALIIQDLGLIELTRQVGFKGELHLSTLTNFSSRKTLTLLNQYPQISRIVLPRELSIDEIKSIAVGCPETIGLEIFVHGALCYGVSGRCYWSSYMGGKSSLRGRCVQPCRRQYSQGQQARRYFSCQDLSLDVLASIVRHQREIKAWKIEGRKKGPHYVYYTVMAYRLLRDIDDQPESRAQAKKTAVALLQQALGRPGTHYNFIPQKAKNPIDINSQTGSGLFVGKIQGSAKRPYIVPRIDLLKGDVLRLGYEDQKWHDVKRIARAVPKNGRYSISPSAKRLPTRGAPVFLTDRREKILKNLMADLEHELYLPEVTEKMVPEVRLRMPDTIRRKPKVRLLKVHRKFSKRSSGGFFGLWLSKEMLGEVPKHNFHRVWWWLPPVVWPGEEDDVSESIAFAQQNGSRYFVLNTPWQTGLFNFDKKLNLWAGPFCNLSNPFSLATVLGLGISGAIISPELGGRDILSLPTQSPLPLGIVIRGNWPLCISRTLAESIQTNRPFTSPKGEKSWVQRYGSNYWVFPNWGIDLTAKESELKKAGFQFFIHLVEPIPKMVELKKRPGLWNWNIGLK